MPCSTGVGVLALHVGIYLLDGFDQLVACN